MSSNITPDVADLFSQAVDRGTLPADSLHALNNLGQEIEDALGISAEDVPASEVFLLTMEIDDSSSIEYANNEKLVTQGHNLVVDELQRSNKGDDILVATTYLNRGNVSPFSPVKSAKRIDGRSYRPYGATPLYDRTLAVLGTVVAKEQEFANQGVPVRTITVIVTDGDDTASQSRPKDVKALVDQLLQTENHIVAFMGIDDGHTDFKKVARSMGIRDRWILTPSNDGHSIREAFGVISRASQTASQGADSFSSVSQTGFDSGIS